MPRINVPAGREQPSLRRWIENDLEPELVRGRTIEHTFTAANVAEPIRHRLGHRPEGYQLVGQDRACRIYADATTPRGTRQWLWLKCDTSGAVTKIRVF